MSGSVDRPEGSATLRVVIVDDDLAFLEACRAYFEFVGIRGFATANPRDALRRLNLERPDVFVVDHRLHTGIDGIDVLERARRISRGVRLVLWSSFAGGAELEGGERLSRINAECYDKGSTGFQRVFRVRNRPS